MSNDEREGFTHLRIEAQRMPHQFARNRRQGLTTAAADLAIMEALHGGRVAICCATGPGARRAYVTMRERMLPIMPFLYQPVFPQDNRILINSGAIRIFSLSEYSAMKGYRASLAISDMDDAIDLTSIPAGLPFDPRMFR